jgi:hypothetical protein
VFTLSGGDNSLEENSSNLQSPVSGLTADWTIVPPTEFYVDTSKRTLVFSTPKAGHYTIIAATIIENKPLVLTFTCDYGVTPSPNPEPEPQPNPEPKTLKDWVKKNVPAAGISEQKFLAECYETVASALERGTLRTTDAAYAALRTSTQTKINVRIWGEFLNGLESQIHDQLGESPTPKDLAAGFRQIASGLE